MSEILESKDVQNGKEKSANTSEDSSQEAQNITDEVTQPKTFDSKGKSTADPGSSPWVENADEDEQNPYPDEFKPFQKRSENDGNS